MDSRIGSVLREARNRRKIDLSEVEAATRIRLRYLRAIENEEWDLLPGGVYTRGFIRTYASFLGLDGERLAEDYRNNVEGGGPAPDPTPAAASPAAGPPRRRWAVLPGSWIAVAAVILVAVFAIVVIPDSDTDGEHPGKGPAQGRQAQGEGQRKVAKTRPSSRGVSVRLAASAEVWVCVLNGRGQALVDGQILAGGSEEGPFRSGSFTVSFGNGEVSMLIDGREAEIPATSSPIGYSIDSSGTLTQLGESERPTCT